jgi:hypothetical protein
MVLSVITMPSSIFTAHPWLVRMVLPTTCQLTPGAPARPTLGLTVPCRVGVAYWSMIRPSTRTLSA